MRIERLDVDVLILGAGAAGMWLAHKLAGIGKVAIAAKGGLAESSTFHAQGGIAAPIGPGDSVEAHLADTIAVGDGLVREEAARALIARGRLVVEELIALGVEFDRDANGRLHLTREGGHSLRRVVHAADSTGKALAQALAAALERVPNLVRIPQAVAVDLVTRRRLGESGEDRCLGAYLLVGERMLCVSARWVVLATGGASRVFLITTNPHVASGDGIAMAWRAYAPIVNMEFVQFHPTCLHHPSGSHFLLSEALRGEGAVLVDAHGRRFAFDYDPRGELAPRDVLARAIDAEMKRQGVDCMYLDARPIGRERIEAQFPNIHRRLLALGIDMTREPIPVAPAAHYTCGGVQALPDGRTPIPGLFAIGEVAHTGLHGANRLASNSLLECLAMADFAAEIIRESAQPAIAPIPDWSEKGIRPERERIPIKQNWEETRITMQNYVGVVRTDARLQQALKRLALIREEVEAFYRAHPVSRGLVELRNLALVAELITRSAWMRKESRGLHYNLDHPDKLPKAEDTVLVRKEGE
ncbi:MAG: L-aspartate oxidase [Zetaproteobacteria bacterium]|nr:MAG: L-aspartate oxidase [Zetaproteobacteria bacterium]